MDETTHEKERRLLSCTHVNWVHPEDTVAYRGETVRYAFEWERQKPSWRSYEPLRRIETAEQHIALVVHRDGGEELLINVDTQSSPAGFCWGYGGSGPHALAMSLLAHHLGEWPKKDAAYDGMPLAFAMHNDLVGDLVSRWPMDEPWRLPRADLEGWVALWKASPGGREQLAHIEQRLHLEEEWRREDEEMEDRLNEEQERTTASDPWEGPERARGAR